MQTRWLLTLTRIASLGSFAAAAEQLNMTLSAVSMQMKTLESELGAALFDRSHRPPQLTPLGRSVCDHAERLLRAEDALVAACRTGDALTGNFRIGFVATASVRLLPGFLTRAERVAPDARFVIETNVSESLEARVRSGLLDAAVVTASSAPPPGLHYTVLRRERMIHAIPSEMTGHAVSDLFRALPFFHFLPHSGIGKLIARHVQRHSDPGNRTHYLDSVEAIMECVNRGIGFTLLPEPDIRRCAANAVALLDPDGPAMFRELVLATTVTGHTAEHADRLAGLFDGPADDPVTPSRADV